MATEVESTEGMVKTGRVEVGVTPSVHSGEPCEMVKNGEAIREDEQDKPVVEELKSQFYRDFVDGTI